MLKKILIGGLVTVVVVAAAFSIYNTTLAARSAPEAQSSMLNTPQADAQGAALGAGQGYGQGAVQSTEPGTAQGYGQGAVQSTAPGTTQGLTPSTGQGYGQSSAQGVGQGGAAQGKGQGGRGNRNAAGDQSGVPDPQPQNGLTEWVSFTGTVSGYAAPAFTLLTDDGQSISAEVGNISYATELGLVLQDGARVSVIGFWDVGGGLALQSLTLLDSGQTFTFRDELGRPLWSGGRGQGGPSQP